MLEFDAALYLVKDKLEILAFITFLAIDHLNEYQIRLSLTILIISQSE